MSCGGCGTIVNGVVGLAKFATGTDRPDDTTIRARRALCLACEHAEPCLDAGIIVIGRKCRCSQCGCAIRAKTAVGSESCPAGKWAAVLR
jgi:hypothetical protein